jgi:hypothetical protein
MARRLSIVRTPPKAGPTINPDELALNAVRRRSVEAAVWGMPIVSVHAMRQGFFGVGADYGDILYFSKPADWKFQITTPNSSSLYVYFNFNLDEGAVVIDVPPARGAGLFGSILDAWQTPIADIGPEGEDKGEGGKYLLLPPEVEGEPPAGYLPLRFSTYNGYALFRAIPKSKSDEDTAAALALVRRLRQYLLAEASNPPDQRHIDIAGELFEGIASYDDTFFDSLAKMTHEEPVQLRDMAIMGQLRAIGIEKGRVFSPDKETRAMLRRSIVEAHAGFMDATVDHVVPYWPHARWGAPPFLNTGVKTGFSFQNESGLDIDARGALFFSTCAPPKKLGAAALCFLSASDANDAHFDGEKRYRLRVPPRVPAKQFWAITVYDVETAAFIWESPKTEVNSYQDLQTNADGSVDVFFGPNAPTGKDSNWIYTAPGARWFSFFRLYGPEAPIHDKSWALNDIEEIK